MSCPLLAGPSEDSGPTDPGPGHPWHHTDAGQEPLSLLPGGTQSGRTPPGVHQTPHPSLLLPRHRHMASVAPHGPARAGRDHGTHVPPEPVHWLGHQPPLCVLLRQCWSRPAANQGGRRERGRVSGGPRRVMTRKPHTGSLPPHPVQEASTGGSVPCPSLCTGSQPCQGRAKRPLQGWWVEVHVTAGRPGPPMGAHGSPRGHGSP